MRCRIQCACSYTTFSTVAPWRPKDNTHTVHEGDAYQVHTYQLSMHLPWFSVDMVVIGVLHCVDLGASAEVFGHMLRDCMQILCGPNTHQWQVLEANSVRTWRRLLRGEAYGQSNTWVRERCKQ